MEHQAGVNGTDVHKEKRSGSVSQKGLYLAVQTTPLCWLVTSLNELMAVAVLGMGQTFKIYGEA